MKYLKQYVDQRNKFAKLFGHAELVIGRDNQKIADQLDCDLSPENLTCDGELRGAQLQAKSRMLYGAAAELRQLDPSVNFYEA